jgi:acyl-CoA hydrolase
METKVICPQCMVTMRLVKSEDLNHHGTLFAGRTAEWFVESGFIAAASLLNPQNVVCLRIHGMFFTKPAKSGDVLKFSSKIVYTGKTSLTSYVHVEKNGDEKPLVDGFVTFIHVNEETKSAPHYLEVNPVSDSDKALYETAKNLRLK